MNEPIGGGYAYSNYGEAPDPSHRPLYLAATLGFLRENGVGAGAAVLDAGCGGGDFSEGLAEAGYRVFGSDLSASGISAARARGIGRFEQASLYEPLAPPFGRERFDAIVCIEVIEHLYSPATFARQAFEALDDDGVLIVSTPYWGYAKNVVLALTNRIDRALTALWEGGHIKHFSRATLTRLMEDAGFELVGFEGRGERWRSHVPYLWSGMILAFRKRAS